MMMKNKTKHLNDKLMWLDNHYHLNPHMMFKCRKELVKEVYKKQYTK